ncbi:uncharacterized protein [Rutidosis leptorrhynchoides]|uniref:uncharacterized protein n=1 Tax=Rutidosis leptorrhynchoides TaxID=125765 RepID=UPI003A99BE5D
MDSERLMEAALNLRAMANGTGASQLERNKYLKEAAEIYKSVGENELAANCFYDMEDYKAAGDIYNNICMWEKAGNCYHRAKCYQLAAEVYHKAGAFTKCLSACSDGELFEVGFELLGGWEGFDKEKLFLQKCADYYDCSRFKIRVFLRKRKFFIELRLLEMEWYNDKEAAQAAEDGADHYHSIKDFTTMMRCVYSFSSKRKMRQFLRKRRCYDQLILLVEHWGNSKKEAENIVDEDENIFDEDENIFDEDENIVDEDENIVDEAAKVVAEAACYYLSVNDFVTMMKYVRLFPSEYEIRGFLKERRCFDQLIKLEKDWNNFKEAENIVVEAARYYLSVNDITSMMKYVGLFPSEGEMWEFLHEKGCFDEGILLEKDENIVAARYCFSVNDFVTMMKYVASFPSEDEKREFLLKRKRFDELISLEKELGNFKEAAKVARMKPDPMLEAQLYRMGGFIRESLLIISRYMLDSHLLLPNKDWTIKHFEAELSEHVVCLEGFIYYWSNWKEVVWGLIKSTLTWLHVCCCNEDECGYEGFIFNYFGVRNHYDDADGDRRYVVVDVEAQWVQKMKPILVRDGYLDIIDADELSYAVSRYWCSELYVVVEEVLIKLKSLHVYATKKNLPVHLHTKVLTSLFQVTKSLQKRKLPYNLNHVASSIVDEYIRPCVEHFLTNVFHIDWRISHAKEMVSLRGTQTCQDMLEETLNIYRKSRGGLKCGQMGRIAMIFLGSNTKKKIRCGYSLNWRDLFSRLTNVHSSTSKNWDLAVSLHNVLKETFPSGFGRRAKDEQISPACFLYFWERLLILSFCFRGHVFTTRSSFVEWIGYEKWRMVSSGVGWIKSLDTMENIYDSLASMVIGMLNLEDALKEWVTKSEEPDSSYATLVLRLIVLLSLICANSEGYYSPLLLHILGRIHLVSLLPPAFSETLITGIHENRLVDAVAAACKQIDNPLVIVNFNQDLVMAPCQNAINLNLQNLNSGRETLIEMLYN